MTLPRYPAYRRGGIAWLEEVPAHWKAPAKLGAISFLKGRLGWQGLKADEYREQGPYVVSSAHFSDFKIRWDECPRVSRQRYETDDNIQLAPGDVLLMKDGAALGKLAFVDHLPGDACLNSHLLLFRPLSFGEGPAYVPKFAFYFMQTGLFQEHIKVNSTGATFFGISQEAIANYQVVWPSHREQKEVVGFLDREISKIDALIAEQEKLIALLAEKRQATVSHVVSRGLDPTAPMRDSGVPWLGEMPAHWSCVRVKHVIRGIEQGWSPQCESFPAEDDEWGVLKVGCVNGGVFDSSENKKLPSNLEPLPQYALRRGDVLVSRANTRELVGSAAHVPSDFPNLMLCDKLYRLCTDVAICEPEFLVLYLGVSAARSQIRGEASGASSSMLNIGQSVLLDLWMPLPPLDEQLAVVGFVQSEVAKLDALTVNCARSIALLQERRLALIAAAVTGQIDVRGTVLQVANQQAVAA